jgi:hypothetical protein
MPKRSLENEAERRAAYALFEAGETIQTIRDGDKSNLSRTALYDVRRSWLALHTAKLSENGKKLDLASFYHWQNPQQAEDHSLPHVPAPKALALSQNLQHQTPIAGDKPDVSQLALSAFKGRRRLVNGLSRRSKSKGSQPG